MATRADEPATFAPAKLLHQAKGFGRFETTYSAIGKIDEEEQTDSMSQNPFAAGGGMFRINVSADVVSGQGWVGLTSGVGLSTQPADTAEAEVDARRRWFTGLLFLADYGSSVENAEHLTGRLALGYADDKLWEWTQTVEQDGATIMRERDESKRWFMDARVDGPGIFESNRVKLSLRLFVDHPKSGDGPTDIRVSLLITADLGSLVGR